MGISISIFLIAIGAVATFAVNHAVNGVDLDVVGIILMVVGSIGLVVSLVAATTRRNLDHQVVERRDLHDHVG